jgi:heat shock protein HslJ
MKFSVLLCTGILILAVFLCGCTSQPAAAPAPQTPVVAAQSQPTSAAGPALIGTNWKLGWFDDTKGMWSKVAEGSTITAKFSADGKLTGFSGCSDYVTDYQLTQTPKVWIKRPAVPEKVCQTPVGVMSQESAYDTDLEWSTTYAITGGQLIFFDKTGKKILQFDPVP